MGAPPLAAALAAALLQAPPAADAAAAPDVKIERLTWVKDVDGESPIRTIEVRNDFGDIRARLAPDRRLDMLAVVQRLDAGPDHLGFTVERRGSSVALTVAYPPGRVKDGEPDPPKASYDRLDLTVFVPEGVVLGAQTLRGMIEGRGLKSDVNAATRDGSLFVATSGTLQARTEGGEITAALGKTHGSRPLVLQSVSGKILALLAPGPQMDIEVLTRGTVTSDFALKDEKGHRVARRQKKTAPRTLLVSSETGPVELRRADR